MADTKRQNTGNKVPVATPNIGVPNMISLENALCGAIGARIRLTTILPAHPTLEGTLFTADPLTNQLALSSNQNPTTGSSDWHILPITSIQSVTLLSLSSPPTSNFSSALPALVPLPPASVLQSRVDQAIARLKEEEARKGKGVGKEAQEIFDALYRTLPTRWSGANIIVLDAVSIASPYRPEDCRAGEGVQAGLLDRVKKVEEVIREDEQASRAAEWASEGRLNTVLMD
ncbi:hypothetical protein MMC24_002021 [Lignoscripta atroalba]|nr:hypothetical protein [Lignoscripta atroalba]